ncbi:hypothetical protein QV09_09690 [Gallibacterium salpingitidis]|uniref:Uncharacterized protein n=2 Tax=Gallibacterium salpingitidis TaxID=505341 RepID=A0AB36E0L5_9PAST|nr:hypothetical protein [Gallibacterium salpingitidis]OBX08353.1 hypothetical protein QV09_09690 [Gallibacterium salpingitidis]
MFDEIADLWREKSIYSRTFAILLSLFIIGAFGGVALASITAVIDYGWVMGLIVFIASSLFIAFMTIVANQLIGLLIALLAGLTHTLFSLCQALYRLAQR